MVSFSHIGEGEWMALFVIVPSGNGMLSAYETEEINIANPPAMIR